MTTLIKTTSLTTLLLLLSGCSQLKNINTPKKPKINENLEVIEFNSIKSISDITSIAFEWKKVEDHNVIGYNFYRANMHKDGRRLKLIKTLDNRYTTHFVDTKLEPNTKYVYQISSNGKDGFESKTTKAYLVKTAPRALPVSFVQAISDLPNRIKLVWRPHEDPRIEYYEIEKFDAKANKWSLLKRIKGRLNAEYIDNDLGNNRAYKYRITALTFEDIKTQASKVVNAKTKPLPLGPQGIKVSINQARKIQLNWEPSPTNDVLRYAIYRSPFEGVGYTKQTEVSKDTLTYSDAIDSDGKGYFYKIYSIDKDGLQSSDDVTPARGLTLPKPAKPIITLAQIQGNKAILNWSAGDRRAKSYNVYKTTKISFFENKTETFTNINALRFEDHNIVNGVQYKYSIQANDEFGLLSDKTQEAELILPKTKN